MTPWKGKWALVTGASAGIGVALAQELAAGGTNLVLTARRTDRLEKLAREFANSDTKRLLDMVQVNCAAVVHLTRLYLPAMVKRGRGDVLIVASTASFQAVPYLSTYAATKAFDLLLAEGLAEEMKPYGIRVCALCPGSTESEFHEVAAQSGVVAAVRNRETAEKVARVGLQALAAGKSYVISGMGNYLGAHSQRLAPRGLVTRVTARMFRPAPAKHA